MNSEVVIAMVVDRPYVLVFLAAFLVVSGAERGWKRTLFWLVSGTFLGWLAEYSSIQNGFPFGDYTYHSESFPRELWLGGVPFFASISFAFLTYFGYSVACTFLSPLRWTGRDLQRIEDPLIASSWQALLLAAGITTWLDLVTDPVAHLGEYWFLGDLYHYHADGFHFHVPLSNYLGWLLTSVCIVFVNQRFDVWLRSRGPAAKGTWLPLRPLWAVASSVGNFAFMIGITLSLFAVEEVPADARLEAVLTSGLLIGGAFVVFAGWRLRNGVLRGSRLDEP
jgi:putative membrane protein